MQDMELAAWIVAAWVLLSVPLGICVGAMLRKSSLGLADVIAMPSQRKRRHRLEIDPRRRSTTRLPNLRGLSQAANSRYPSLRRR